MWRRRPRRRLQERSQETNAAEGGGATCSSATWLRQISHEPIARETRHLFERSRLLEQMRGAWDDLEPPHCRHPFVRLLIHLDYRLVVAADDEQRRRFYVRQGGTGQV